MSNLVLRLVLGANLYTVCILYVVIRIQSHVQLGGEICEEQLLVTTCVVCKICTR